MNSPRRSFLCPNCNKLISGDESVCPHCGISRPGSIWKSNIWTRGLLSSDNVVKTIISVNVVMYAVSLLLNPSRLGLSGGPFSLLSPSNRALVILGASGTIPIDRLHRWWSLISANYLHGGILHILFNMIALTQIARPVLSEYGVHRLIVVYTVGGASGFLVSYLAGVSLTLGASAAVLSLIGACLYYGWSRGGTYGQAVYRQTLGWVVAIFIFGLLFPGIDNWGHAGGLAAGMLLGFLLGYEEKKPENYYHKLLAGICVLFTVAVLAWSIGSSFYYRLSG